MKTRKLVLSFCALAAITGAGAPQVFGGTDMELMSLDNVGVPQEAPVTVEVPQAVENTGTKPQVMELVFRKFTLKGSDAVLSHDPARQAAYEKALRTEDRRVANQVAELKQMGDSEVYCVWRARCNRQLANLVRRIAAGKLGKACRIVASTRNELLSAEKIAKQALCDLFRMTATARICKLKGDLARALGYKELMLQKYFKSGNESRRCIEEAQRYTGFARDWRALRVKRSTKMLEDDIRRRGDDGQAKVFERLKAGNLSVIEREQIRVSAIKDVIILSSWRDNLQRDVFAVRLHDVNSLRCTFSDIKDEQCRKWWEWEDETYIQEKYSYGSDDQPFEQLASRRREVFGAAWALEKASNLCK